MAFPNRPGASWRPRRQPIAYTALILGACLTVSALVRLD